MLKLAEALRDHVELMRAGATDLVCKFRAFLATPGSFPSLPLVVDANTRQATLDWACDPIPDCRRKAVATLARYSTTPNTPAVAHYSLACIGARDYRIGAASDEAVLDKVKLHLKAAVERDRLRFGTRWRSDPDFAPLRHKLSDDEIMRLGDQLDLTRTPA